MRITIFHVNNKKGSILQLCCANARVKEKGKTVKCRKRFNKESGKIEKNTKKSFQHFNKDIGGTVIIDFSPTYHTKIKFPEAQASFLVVLVDT